MSQEEILRLAQAMGATEDFEVLLPLCRAAMAELEGRLREDADAEQCAPLFSVAAAWLVLDSLEAMEGGDVTALSAGDLSVRVDGGSAKNGSLRRRALELMSPYLKDGGFAMRGVEG